MPSSTSNQNQRRMLKHKNILISFCLLLAGLYSYAQTPATPSKAEIQKRQDEIKAEYHLIKGMGKLMLEDYDEALKLFKAALNLSPDNAGVHYKIAEVYFYQGVKSQATVHVKEAIKIDPNKESYYVLLANIYKSDLRPELAAGAYEMLLKKKPKLVDYHFDLAEIYADLGRHYFQRKAELSVATEGKKKKREKKLKEVSEKMDLYLNKAMRSLTAIEKKYGLSEEITTNKQLIFLRQNKLEEAYKEGNRLIEAFPDEPKYQLYQAEFYESNSEFERAVELLEKTAKDHPKYGAANMMLYKLYKKLDRDDLAMEHLKKSFKDPDIDVTKKRTLLNSFFLSFEEEESKQTLDYLTKILIDVHPQSAPAYMTRGDYYQAADEKDKALNTFLKAIDIDENNVGNWMKVLTFDYELDQSDSLIKHSESAIELFPNQSELWLYNGLGYSMNEEHEKAIASMEAGKRLAFGTPMEPTFNAQLGDIYNSAKEFDKSDAAYEAVLAINPEDPHVLNNYAYFLSVRGDKLKLAKTLSTKLVTAYPNDPTYLDTHAWVLFKLGEYEESKSFLESALMSSDDGTIIEHYGDVLSKLGSTDLAVEQWIKAKKSGGTTENIDKKIEEKKYIP